MATKKTALPSQVDFLRLLQVLLVLVVLTLAVRPLVGDHTLTSALALSYIVLFGLRYGLGQVVARHHRRGIALVKEQEWSQALTAFAASAAFFARHPWVDTFRQFTLLSASLLSYREMALVNQAFCYSQLGDGQAARRQYELALAEFPDSALALAGLRTLDAGRATLSAE